MKNPTEDMSNEPSGRVATAVTNGSNRELQLQPQGINLATREPKWKYGKVNELQRPKEIMNPVV